MTISTFISFHNLTYNSGNSSAFENSENNFSVDYFSIENKHNVTYFETNQYLNTSNESEIKRRSLAEILMVSLALGCLILATIIGNIFVISAIILEKNLKSVGNYLVLSLAVTDLLVACLVMPLGALYEITQEWTLGSALCELWTCTDVLCCTASILHLLAIACDRFWAVTNVDYVHQRNARHIGGMILTVWIISAVISLGPILGWKDIDFIRRIEEEKRCLVSQDISYQIFATLFSFYGPSALVLILYYRIYLVAKKRIRRKSTGTVRKSRRPNSCPPAANTYTSSTEMTTMTYNISSSNASSENGSANSYQILVSTNSRNLLLPPQPFHPFNSINTTIVPDFISGASTSDNLEVLGVPSIELHRDSNSSNSNHISFDSTNSTAIQINGKSNIQKSRSQPLKRLKLRKRSSNEREVENKRERKAAKTLAIITGIFMVCWLPFFAVALIMPLCRDCVINPYLFSFCLWLGWANSSVNPFLYTIFSPDFRSAFRKMIFGRKLRTKR